MAIVHELQIPECGHPVDAALDQESLPEPFLATLAPPRAEQIAVLKKLHARVRGNLTLVANAILNLDEVINKN